MKKDQQFCGKCGTKVEEIIEEKVETPKQFCGSCGKELEKDEIFCGNCGVKKEEQVGNKKQEKPAKPVKEKKKRRVLPIVLILIVVIVGAGYYYMYRLNSPDEIVKRFCKTMEEEEYEKMFSTLSFPESEYINKEIFAEYMKSGNNEEISEIDYKFLEDESDDDERVYEVIVTIDEDEETDEITLIKQDSKKYFLFDDWGIETYSMIIDEWEISVPRGSTLSINDKEVKSGKTEEDGNDVYVVKDLLRVPYKVKVTHPLAEEYSENITPILPSNIELDAKSNLEGELENYFSNFIREFYVSILQTGNITSSNGVTASRVSNMTQNVNAEEEAAGNVTIPNNDVVKPEIEPEKSGIRKYVRDDQAYADVTNQGKIIKENIVNSLSYYYQNVDIKNVVVTYFNTDDISITGENTVKLETSCTLSFDYLFKDSYSNSTYRHYSGTKELELTVVKVNNTWLIINIK
jgi:uncharacterized membrane protein YvbJ